jgi:hypothetical protein
MAASKASAIWAQKSRYCDFSKCICGQTFTGLGLSNWRGPLKKIYAPLMMASVENAKKLWTV